MKPYTKFIIFVFISCLFFTGCATQNNIFQEIENSVTGNITGLPDTPTPPVGTSNIQTSAETTTDPTNPTDPADPISSATSVSDVPTTTSNTATQQISTATAPITNTPVPSISPNTAPPIKAGTLSGYIIGIDPGHQAKSNPAHEPIAPGSAITRAKVSSGTQGRWTRVPEYKVVLIVGLQLKELLEQAGATVIMSRETNDVDIPNSKRAIMMNEQNADLVIRIHIDGNENPNIYGACMLVPSGNNNTNIHAQSDKAGRIILEEFTKITGAKNNGVIKRSDLTGFNWSTVPVCLVEMGYMTNKDEDYMLINADYQKKCVEGLFAGIIKCFSQ